MVCFDKVVILGATLAFGHGALAAETAEEVAARQADEPYFNSARQCSSDALRRYALTSPDPAEKVAQVAFQKCTDLWRGAFERGVRRREADTKIQESERELRKNCIKTYGASEPRCNPMPPIYYLMDSAEKQFIQYWTPIVFDVRAEAAGK